MEIYIPFRLAEICLLMESKKYEFLKTVFLMACLLYIFSAIKALQSYRLVVGTTWGMIFDKYCRFFTEFNGFRNNYVILQFLVEDERAVKNETYRGFPIWYF